MQKAPLSGQRVLIIACARWLLVECKPAALQQPCAVGDLTSGTDLTTPHSTLDRPAHCMRAVTGEPPTSPSAACPISAAASSWNSSARRAGGGAGWVRWARAKLLLAPSLPAFSYSWGACCSALPHHSLSHGPREALHLAWTLFGRTHATSRLPTVLPAAT